MLLKNKVNLNIQTSSGWPLLFNVNTVEEAQLFVDNDVDLHVVSGYYARMSNFKTNVLWGTVLEGYSSELMKFYLDHHVDARNLNHRGECLLACAWRFFLRNH